MIIDSPPSTLQYRDPEEVEREQQEAAAAKALPAASEEPAAVEGVSDWEITGGANAAIAAAATTQAPAADAGSSPKPFFTFFSPFLVLSSLSFRNMSLSFPPIQTIGPQQVSIGPPLLVSPTGLPRRTKNSKVVFRSNLSTLQLEKDHQLLSPPWSNEYCGLFFFGVESGISLSRDFISFWWSALQKKSKKTSTFCPFRRVVFSTHFRALFLFVCSCGSRERDSNLRLCEILLPLSLLSLNFVPHSRMPRAAHKDRAPPPIKTSLVHLGQTQPTAFALQCQLFFNSEQWISPLHNDIQALLSTFESEWLQELQKQGTAGGVGGSGGGGIPTSTEGFNSPFQLFRRLWKDKGWSLVHLLGIADGPVRDPWGESVIRGFAGKSLPLSLSLALCVALSYRARSGEHYQGA